VKFDQHHCHYLALNVQAWWVAGARIWWVRTRKSAVSVLEAAGMPTIERRPSCAPTHAWSKCDSLHSHGPPSATV
jgi:hypothetical protein